MNSFLNELNRQAHLTTTENGAVTHSTSDSYLLDLFSLGGAFRNRDAADCERLFALAYAENPLYAMKCLFYLRDVIEGQGERRFFRTCLRWLANSHTHIARYTLTWIPEYGRWDDLYAFVGTPVEEDAFTYMRTQFQCDLMSTTPSLLGKWLKSPNASSKETKKLARITYNYFGLTEKEYRKALSTLRKRINVVERLISSNQWDKVIFDKIPSAAGLKYRNAFARHDAERYAAFIANKKTKVNAAVLTPYDIAHKIFYNKCFTLVEREALQKYWNNLPDIYRGREENGIAIVDVSGSMCGQPMEVAVSMGAYIAERSKGPFANHFITFSERPELVRIVGNDIFEKLYNISRANWDLNTNIEKVFDLLLNTALSEKVKTKDMPERIYIFSDMEFDCACELNQKQGNTLFEEIKKKWETHGYKLPNVVFWNLDARQNNIPAIGEGFSYISGFSPVILDAIFSGKTGNDLMMEKLNSKRYEKIDWA